MTRTDDATQPPLPEDAPRGPALPGLEQALRAPDASVRLRVALEAGTRPAPGDVLPLLRRCEEEPDFFVREMLTWALTRHPTDVTVPLLLAQLTSPVPQTRSQSPAHPLEARRCARLADDHRRVADRCGRRGGPDRVADRRGPGPSQGGREASRDASRANWGAATRSCGGAWPGRTCNWGTPRRPC